VIAVDDKRISLVTDQRAAERLLVAWELCKVP
jgi:hypothetical protein